jgi:4-amino-4-deoxy-L-arabinose transferase-like glycosyltransferase/putative flippase GtrA
MTTIASRDDRHLTPLRLRLDSIRRSPHSGKVVRCLLVSAFTTCVSLTVLTVLLRGVGMTAWMANVLAVAVGTVPSYLLNRRWVWGVSGPSDPGREVAPFWLMSFAGLVVSTFAVDVIDRVATNASWGSGVHTAAVLAANVGAFALLWIAQYLVLDRVLFGPRVSRSVDLLGPPDTDLTDGAGVTSVEPIAPPVDLAAGFVRPDGRIRRWWRGRPEDPAWVRPSLIALLVATAVLYLWNLSASGWANSFYAAAVQAGTMSWKALFFGSSDAANSITVDKPPLSLWPMEISARVFGLSSWSLLVPQALMGVASVGLVYATVRRWFRAGAGLLAGAVLALTPVAALMFRFDNPDALLTLLMCGAAYTALRGIESAKVRWSVATGVLIGLGFLTKQLQVLLVVPGFAFAYLVAARAAFWRRVRDLAVAGGSMIAAAGWWMAIVMLTPVSSRPYIGGSQHNSVWELTFGYNGFGRLTGNETGSVGGGGAGGTGMWGATGLTRMFGTEIGGQIAWLMPAALAALLLGLWLTRRARRTDMARASLLVWGGWLAVTAGTFSLMAGIFHAYYTVALAPAVAALVGIGASMLWSRRSSWWATATMGVATMASACWAAVLLDRATGWNTWLAPMIVVAGCVAAVGFAAAALLSDTGHGVVRARVLSASAVLALGAVLAGPTAWTIQTLSTPHTGSIVTAGPTVAGAMGGPGGGFGRPGAGPGGGTFTPPTGFTPPAGFTSPGGSTTPTTGGATGGLGGTRGGTGGVGGLLNGSTPSAALVQALEKDASSYTWVAATVGSNSASGYQLSTGDAVMPIGGFNGSDPSPTLAQFEQWVHEGRIHYFIGGGGFGGGGGGFGGGPGTSTGGSNVSQQISSWVSSHFTSTTVGGVTLYDLTQPVASS